MEILKFVTVTALVAAASLFMISKIRKINNCKNDETDGAVRHRINKKAPHTINSRDITFFSCCFSAFGMLEEDTHLAGKNYTLEAKLENDVAVCSYASRYRGTGISNIRFTSDVSIMTELQKIVAEYDFAQHNGYYYHISGLPDMYGMELSVCYASGESISAANNQSIFLPITALEELESLFLRRAESSARDTTDK